MKKLFITTLILGAVTIDVFATGLNANETTAPCDNDTLGQTSGTVNMEIDWQPNTIDIRWYNGNTLLNPTNTDANTCAYGGDLYLPDAPTRKGYTFDGWELRPQYNFSLLDTSINGTEYWAKVKDNYTGQENVKECNHNASYQSCNARVAYKELQYHEWKVSFDYGTIYGMGKCSTTTGYASVRDSINETTGNYCWCKATGFKPLNSDTIYAPSEKLSWVAYASAESAIYCLYRCSVYCAYAVNVNFEKFRPKLFGQ